MKPLTVAALAFLMTFANFEAWSQTDCPKLEIVGPQSIVLPGDTADFTARLSPAKQSELSYKWEIDLGTVIKGSVAEKVTVLTDQNPGFRSLTATVTVDGLPAGCPNTASETVAVAANIDYFPIDEYGRLPYNDERGRLDLALQEINDHPNFQFLFVLHAPAKASKASLTERKRRIDQHLISLRKFPKTNLHFVRRESTRTSTEIYILPPDLIKTFIGDDRIVP
jgi:hypothetical protein